MAGSTTTPPGRKAPRFGLGADGTSSPLMLMIKIIGLGFITAVALCAALPLFRADNWLGLAVVAAVTAWRLLRLPVPPHRADEVPVPGTLFLIAFQVVPVSTPSRPRSRTSATATAAPRKRRSPPSRELGQAGRPTPRVHPDPRHGRRRGHGRPRLPALRPAPARSSSARPTGSSRSTPGPSSRRHRRQVTAADGTPSSRRPRQRPQDEITAFTSPPRTAPSGPGPVAPRSRGAPQQTYDADCDCITDAATGNVWAADADEGSFVDADGEAPRPGLEGQRRLRQLRRGSSPTHDPRVLPADPGVELRLRARLPWSSPSRSACWWRSRSTTADAGPRLYRSLLVLPYAMPAFAMLLVWRDMFNTDFGLINQCSARHQLVRQPGQLGSRDPAVQLWLGYPYMFLVMHRCAPGHPAELRRRPGSTAPRRCRPSGPSPCRCCWSPWPRC